MSLRELGERLRHERMNKGLSLDEVVERTKISRRNITAIEEGREDDLPHAVYSRGFIRNYAELLGVDLAEYDEVLNEALPIEDDFSEEAARELKKDLKLHSGSRAGAKVVRTIVLLVVLAAAVGVGVWMLPKSVSPPDESGTTPAVTPDQAPVEEPVASPEPSPVTPAEPESPRVDGAMDEEPAADELDALERREPDGPEAAEESPPAADDAAEGGVESGPAAPESSPEALEGPTAEEVPAPAPEEGAETVGEQAETRTMSAGEAVGGREHLVVVSATEACWMETNTDGGSVREYYLRPGEKLRLPFDESLRLRLGNAGGVDVVYDGQTVPLGAESGQVRTLDFPPQ
ncbi:helix-turn-helix domain-containing protein [Desulfohalovibrio reitneri]|uniref:helix-turn-helix domain-containing protein n=1 Tax=Desulfohalovibrio reitneri TaxID=1307759 RepID=UPI0004A6BBB1|nr:helix-turn-helix domain-containing protein [Desulfohalovibrio reitneri]